MTQYQLKLSDTPLKVMDLTVWAQILFITPTCSTLHIPLTPDCE